MRRPSDEPTAWLVRAEGGHSEGRGPRGSLPVCRGQLPWQARIRPGMGPPSWPAAEWGPGAASSRRAAPGQRGPLPRQMPGCWWQLACQVSTRTPVGPRVGGRGGLSREGGGPASGEWPALTLPAPSSPTGQCSAWQRVGAPSPAARRQQGVSPASRTRVSHVHACLLWRLLWSRKGGLLVF